MDFIAYMSFYSNFKDNNENYRPSKNTLPNNWGRQDYDGRKFDVIIKPQIDTNNLSEKRGWIIAYAETQLPSMILGKNNPLLKRKRYRSYKRNHS